MDFMSFIASGFNRNGTAANYFLSVGLKLLSSMTIKSGYVAIGLVGIGL